MHAVVFVLRHQIALFMRAADDCCMGSNAQLVL
jgi:hypothetical protein